MKRTNEARGRYPWTVLATMGGKEDNGHAFGTLRDARAYLAEIRAFHAAEGSRCTYADGRHGWVTRGLLTVKHVDGLGDWTFEIIPE